MDSQQFFLSSLLKVRSAAVLYELAFTALLLLISLSIATELPPSRNFPNQIVSKTSRGATCIIRVCSDDAAVGYRYCESWRCGWRWKLSFGLNMLIIMLVIGSMIWC